MLNEGEDVLHAARDDSTVWVATTVLEAFHRMRLARSSLPVGKDRGVVAFENGVDSLLCRSVVDLLLSRIHIVNMVEAVSVPHLQMRVHFYVLGLLPIVDLPPEVLHAGDRATVGCHLHNGKEEVALLFALQGRPQSDDHFEILLVRGALARL